MVLEWILIHIMTKQGIANWTKAIMEEYPNFNIVGRDLDARPGSDFLLAKG